MPSSTVGAKSLPIDSALKDFQDAVAAIHLLLGQLDRRARPLSEREPVSSRTSESELGYVRRFATTLAAVPEEERPKLDIPDCEQQGPKPSANL
jgi:hypothetical protein